MSEHSYHVDKQRQKLTKLGDRNKEKDPERQINQRKTATVLTNTDQMVFKYQCGDQRTKNATTMIYNATNLVFGSRLYWP